MPYVVSINHGRETKYLFEIRNLINHVQQTSLKTFKSHLFDGLIEYLQLEESVRNVRRAESNSFTKRSAHGD